MSYEIVKDDVIRDMKNYMMCPSTTSFIINCQNENKM